MSYVGNATKKQLNREGACDPDFCLRYLVSYEINGTMEVQENGVILC